MGKFRNTKDKLIRIAVLGMVALGLVLGGPVPAAARHSHRQKVAQKSSQGVVNINTATEAQLELLPGIGPSKARAIARHRARRKFKATYELIRIRGIGRKTYRRLRSYLTVKGPTTLTERPKREQRKQSQR